jgi:hypothetical protein
MENTLYLILIIGLLCISASLAATEATKPQIHVFHKHKAPSLRALEKINEALAPHKETYRISYHDIEDEANLELIESFGLPSTHFPIAVVIDGKFSIKIQDKIISFVHFPDFMQGIGRHEGAWSIADLEAALVDNSLLLDIGILPEMNEDEFESTCE